VDLFDRTTRAVGRAARLRRAGDAPGAVDILADILLAQPEHAAANAEMGRALRLLGDPAGAEEHLRRAIGTVLDYTLVVELAGALAEQSKVDEAEENIDAALYMTERMPRLDPAEALIVRAVIAHAQGRDAEALGVLEGVVAKRSSKQTLRHVRRIRDAIEASAAQPQPELGDRG